MIFNLSAWSKPGRFQRFLLTGAFLTLCLAVLTRYQLLNGFTILPGDRYDGVISTVILEHWSRFFSGAANWSEVNYFFPYTRTIAQNDGYFLIGVAYFPFRLFGLDPFISAELAGLVLKSTGFVGAYLLCRKVFSFSFYWAMLAAILFTLSNGMTVHSSRVQLATIAFAPIMAILLWSMFNAFLDGNPAKLRGSGLIAGMFFGAWCLTCFYMAWFFSFFFTVFAVVMLVLGGRSGFSVLKERLAAHYGSVIFVAGSTLVSLLPFIYAFLPKSGEVGVRSYREASMWSVPIEGILQVGDENFLFGRLYNSILHYISPSYSPYGEYYNTGFSIILFFLFVCGFVQVVQHARRQNTEVVLPSLVITTVATWMLALNISGHSGWFFVYHMFPGAKALRVVAAYQIFLALPVVIIAVKYLSIQRIALPIVLLLSALLVAGEINNPPLALNRLAELDRISLPCLPPGECHVFYTSGWEGQEGLGEGGEFYAHNVSAMFLAQIAGIPTINGIGSFNPPDWNFAYPNKSDYDERVVLYAKKHGITGLCKLDLNSKQWFVINDSAIASPTATLDFFKKSPWQGGGISRAQGLDSPDPLWTWSLADVVSIEFIMPLPERFSVHLVAGAFGPNVGKEFVAHVGDSAFRFTLAGRAEERMLEFSNPKRSKIITIDVPSPCSPKELGLSDDTRRLGIALWELRIEPL